MDLMERGYDLCVVEVARGSGVRDELAVRCDLYEAPSHCPWLAFRDSHA